jgi:hypothetical protein
MTSVIIFRFRDCCRGSKGLLPPPLFFKFFFFLLFSAQLCSDVAQSSPAVHRSVSETLTLCLPQLLHASALFLVWRSLGGGLPGPKDSG